VVVGAGAAGLYTALVAADEGASVCLVSRKPLAESASFWAQGGLAAALGADDSPEQHAEDTLNAGRAACRRSAVEILCTEAPAVIDDLRGRGVSFDVDRSGALALGLEGGHSRRRVVHAGGSATGRRITRELSAAASAHPSIEVWEETSALALWAGAGRCVGAVTDRGRVLAGATVLATGGGAALWRRTTNPWGAIGAGPVFAHAAGAELADLELCQFHPTALSLPGRPQDGFLVTEAIRGEGAVLRDASGERFTDELAPRDAVTSAVLARMEANDSHCVHLDMRSVDARRFANVAAVLNEAGIEPSRDLVPVSPAAHYLIGGVATDTAGRASLGGLYAVGECAANGLHGANRLASNSLSECFVFGARTARAALDEPRPDSATPLPAWRFEPPTESIRDAVWRGAGPERSAAGLASLSGARYPLARLISAAALERRESRGVHWRVDFPEADPAFDHVHLVHEAGGGLRRQAWD
jgi:L-aspartate oxidase